MARNVARMARMARMARTLVNLRQKLQDKEFKISGEVLKSQA